MSPDGNCRSLPGIPRWSSGAIRRRVGVWLLFLIVLVPVSLVVSRPPVAHASPMLGTCTNTAVSPCLSFHGGFVQHHPKVFLVFWGPNWNNPDGQAIINQVNSTFQAIAGSTYNATLSQYSDGTDYVHNDVELVASVVDSTPPPANIALGIESSIGVLPQSPSAYGGQARDEATRAVAAYGWHTSSDSNIIVIPQAGSTYYNYPFQQAWCGMHAYDSTASTGQFAYSLVKYGDQKACPQTGDPATNTATNIAWNAIHEYVETATDPKLTLGINLGTIIGVNANGWFVNDGSFTPNEVADECSGYWGNPGNPAHQDYLDPITGLYYSLPLLWNNHDNGCVATANTSDLLYQRRCVGTVGDATGTYGSSQALSQPDGTVYAFFEGSDGGLYCASYIANNGIGWTEAQPLAPPGVMMYGTEPSVVTSTSGSLDVFWQGSDRLLYHVYRNNGSGNDLPGPWLSPPEPLYQAGTLGGPPKAVAQSDGQEQVFWRGTDNNLWHMWYIWGQGWYGAQQLTYNGNMASDPAPVHTTTNTWDIFWTGTDGNLWHVYSNGGSPWSAAQSLGAGPLGGSGPSAYGQSDGSIQVVWQGQDGNVWHEWYTPGQWHNRLPITSNYNVGLDPAVVNRGYGLWNVFYDGTDSNLYNVYSTDGGFTWTTQDLGMGPLGFDYAPFATAQQYGPVDVFWPGTEGGTPYNPLPPELWHAWWNGSAWNGPQDLGGQVI